MNIAPISNNNQTFYGKGSKGFNSGVKKFCNKLLNRMECSASRIAETKMSITEPFLGFSKNVTKRSH